MATVIHRVLVVRKFPTSVPALVAYATAVADGVSSDARFTTLSSDVTKLRTDTAALVSSQAIVQHRTPGAAAARNADKAVVTGDLEMLAVKVQLLADASSADAASMIDASRFRSRQAATGGIHDPHAIAGPGPGVATLMAKAIRKGGKAVYEWQATTDLTKPWSTVLHEPYSKVTIEGLTSGTLYSFRYRTTVKKVSSDWSAVVSLMVK